MRHPTAGEGPLEPLFRFSAGDTYVDHCQSFARPMILLIHETSAHFCSRRVSLGWRHFVRFILALKEGAAAKTMVNLSMLWRFLDLRDVAQLMIETRSSISQGLVCRYCMVFGIL